MTARLRYRSPIGPLTVEAGEEGVFGISFSAAGPVQGGVSARARAHLEAAEEALTEYFAGRPPSVPALYLRGTPFQQAVWKALLAIPFGEVRTYGEIARQIGSGARAVGGANHQNPVPILVPCHRVVAVNGGLGGYGGGTDRKRWLLAHEAAHAPALRAP
ncbi:MAG TPA: methylated-DNA--[protein]-cysteine S-methyltransferase [Anaeromyxobacter sp.]|nr:methylated-DNA--[protein]-cysteine S-methyltransferase [Anaeromyxobacter sp.]